MRERCKMKKRKKKKHFYFQRKSLFWYQITDCDDIYHFYRQLFHERTTEPIKPETYKQCYYNAWRVMCLKSKETWQKMFSASSMTQPVQSISTFKIGLHISKLKLFPLESNYAQFHLWIDWTGAVYCLRCKLSETPKSEEKKIQFD